MSLFGKLDAPTSIPKFLDRGQVIKVNVTAGGTGYTNGTAATFTAAPGGGVTATGTIAVTGGIITGVNITNPGAGYTTAPTVTATGGSAATFASKIAPNNYVIGNLVFVDTTEAALLVNKSKGITAPGWWNVIQRVDASGAPRYKAEHIVALSNTAGAAGDAADDLVAPDIELIIGISVHPANQNTAAGAATFGVTASFTTGSGTLTYQWQKSVAGSTRFVNVVGQTAATTVLAGQVVGNTGDRYRVLVSGSGAKTVVSNPATLTFVS